MEASKLGKGRCILYNEKPYRIKDVRNVVVSTHSHTRTKIELEDVFTGAPLSINLPPHESVREVDIPRKRGQLVAKIGEDIVHVMDMFSYETFDAAIDKDLLEEVVEGDEIFFIDYENIKKVIGKKGN